VVGVCQYRPGTIAERVRVVDMSPRSNWGLTFGVGVSMEYNRDFIKLVQRELSEQTGIKLSIDGIVGKRTQTVLLYIDQIPSEWPIRRKIIGYFQYLCATEAINAGPIDGYIGPQTDAAYNQYVDDKSGEWVPWRTDEEEDANDMIKYYGKRGTNQTKVHVPYTLKLAWNKTQKINKFTCHEKVADSILRVLNRVLDYYDTRISSLGLDLFGGCLNVRKKRGGTTWSTHSWGVAIDWDPARNQLKWNHTKANFANPEYDKWFQLWEDEGWASMGRIRDYDWMHISAVQIRKK
jgi:hypothetical protein